MNISVSHFGLAVQPEHTKDEEIGYRRRSELKFLIPAISVCI